MMISNLKVNGQAYTKPHSVVVVHALKPINEGPGERFDVGKIGKLLDTPKAGLLVAGSAWSGIQLSNTLTQDGLTRFLITNDVTEIQASHIANYALQILKTTPAKAFLFAVAAGGAAWTVLEEGAKSWPLRRKLSVVSIAALLAAIAYLILHLTGILK